MSEIFFLVLFRALAFLFSFCLDYPRPFASLLEAVDRLFSEPELSYSKNLDRS